MRLPIVILLFATCTLAEFDEETLGHLGATISSCESEHDLTDEELERDRVHENIDNNPKYKEYFLCVFKKEGLIKESGELETEIIRSKFEATGVTDDQSTQIFECSGGKPTPGETAIQFVKCIYEHVKLDFGDD